MDATAGLPADVARLPGVLLAGGVMTPSQISLLVLVLGLATLMLIITRRRIRAGRDSPKAYAHEQVRLLREEREVQQDVQGVMMELEQLARQIIAQIDTRYAKLEGVIGDADERIAALTRLVHAAQPGPIVDVTVGAEPAASTARSDARDTIPEQILALADAGKNPTQIAREVGQTVGEVELILALRQPVPSRSP